MRGKQSFKQIAAFLLALCMTLEMLPISVVAAELDQTQEQHEEETVHPVRQVYPQVISKPTKTERSLS